MSFAQFEYDENTLVAILDSCMRNAFRYQMKNNPAIGKSADPDEQVRLDEGRTIANKLFHLDFAEDMGLMKPIAHSTKRNPLVHDISGNPVSVSTYRITYRGIRYLQSPKWRRWLLKSFHGISLHALSTVLIACLSLSISTLLLISLWIK